MFRNGRSYYYVFYVWSYFWSQFLHQLLPKLPNLDPEFQKQVWTGETKIFKCKSLQETIIENNAFPNKGSFYLPSSQIIDPSIQEKNEKR